MMHQTGGKLNANDFYNLLNGSYDGKKSYGDYKLDKDLSSKTSKVYHNPNTNQAVVAHRGTQGLKDWYNNAVYALGGIKQYKKTKRFKEAQKVQNNAEEKYGRNDITTIGHSQGGLQADLLGRKGFETLTYNKPYLRKLKGLNNNYSVRTSYDPVSYIGSDDNYLTLNSKSINPLKEHSLSELQGLDKNMIIGRGSVKIRYIRR